MRIIKNISRIHKNNLNALQLTKPWVIRATPADNIWGGVCYCPGLELFVAVASSGVGNRVMTSRDGVAWTIQTSGADNSWASVATGITSSDGPVLIAVSSSGVGNRVMRSINGTTWATRTTPADNNWTDVVFGNGTWVAVANSGVGNRVMTSTADGLTWTIGSSPSDSGWICVAYGNGVFVSMALSGADRCMTSPDGINWTVRSIAARGWRAITFGQGKFVAVSSDGYIGISLDGINWTESILPYKAGRATSFTSAACMTYGNGVFVVAGDDFSTNESFFYSMDGFTWREKTMPTTNKVQRICFGDNFFVGVINVGTGNRVVTSETIVD